MILNYYTGNDYHKLSEEEKQAMKIDEIFAFYLFDVAKKVNPDYFKNILVFIIYYRECLNLHGWSKC